MSESTTPNSLQTTRARDRLPVLLVGIAGALTGLAVGVLLNGLFRDRAKSRDRGSWEEGRLRVECRPSEPGEWTGEQVDGSVPRTQEKGSAGAERPRTIVLVRDRPRVCVIEDFLTPEECDHLIGLGEPKMERSRVQAGSGFAPSETRTSYTANLERGQDPVVRRIEERASLLAGIPVDHTEPLQVVRYRPGQQFKLHHDYLEPGPALSNGGQRRVTVFVYLNEARGPDDAKGHTAFPKLGLRFRPKRGRAILWHDCDPEGKVYPETLHAGEPPVGFTKYGCNIWIRERPYK